MVQRNAPLRRILTRSCRQLCKPLILCIALTAITNPSLAQQEPSSTTLDDLPRVRHLAAALADPDSRIDTLFTMTVVAGTLGAMATARVDDPQALANQFREDRAWLDRLATRYLQIPMRSTVLDPAAWLIAEELDQHDLDPSALVSPLGPDMEVLLAQLFDRSEEQLASTLLPEVLVRVEILSIPIWGSLRQSAGENDVLLAVLAGLNSDWFDPWMAAEPPAPVSTTDDKLEQARRSLEVFAETSALAGPPDSLALKRLRFELLNAQAGKDEEWLRESAYVLRLASGFESIHEHKHLSFVEALLWVVADILQRAKADPEFLSPVSGLLADILPRVSNAYARQFSDIDPKINAAIAAAYDAVHNIKNGDVAKTRLQALSSGLADAVAQIVLLIADMDYYFQQPVRSRVAEEIDICISIAAARNRDGTAAMGRGQFNRCLQAMVQLVDRDARSAELSGDDAGPFGADYLQRELELPPWQRINYVLGYMHQQFAAMCEPNAEPLPNPHEWAVLATLMTWFAERSPVYFQTPENEALILRMRNHGIGLLHELSRQADCFAGAGGGINDPVIRSARDYSAAVLELIQGIREEELEFRSGHLRPGADVVLSGDASQRTSYRSEGLAIRPCDERRTCGMTEALEATRALVGMFPDPYLIADQTGMGQIEICYDNVEWLNRRQELLREEDSFVADYYGHLGFELHGRYVEKGEATSVFGARFVSPDEYHYLFAARDDEVLEDNCPIERIGTKISATLSKDRTLPIVPNRLTYLTSLRSRPSRVFAANWSQGEEWRDWFVTGIGVTSIDHDGDPTIGDRVGQHLQALYQSQQAALYSALLSPPGTDAGQSNLYELANAVSNRKALMRSIVSLFYPSQQLDSDAVRMALEGQSGLLDRAVLQRFRDANVPISSISDVGTLRLETFLGHWNKLPESVRRTGSVANSVAHALTRLNTLYREYFAVPTPPAPRPNLTPADAAN